VVVFVL
jgi:dipeptidyl aminopeptidase/acylaminoacyl peptidase